MHTHGPKVILLDIAGIPMNATTLAAGEHFWFIASSGRDKNNTKREVVALV